MRRYIDYYLYAVIANSKEIRAVYSLVICLGSILRGAKDILCLAGESEI